jgi:hypothetical protein
MLIAPVAPPAALGGEAVAPAALDSSPAAGLFVMLQGNVTTVPAAPPTVISTNPLVIEQSRSLTGHIDRLGDVTGIVTVICNYTTGTYATSFTLQTSPGNTVTGTGTGWLTPTATSGAFAYTEINTISGGTGTFAGALGVIICRGQVNASTGVEVGNLAGAILPAHDRRH